MRGPRFLFACLLSSFATFWGTPSYAQISPDQTLGSEASVVFPDQVIDGDLVDVIGRGTLRGENLFHSFSEFNIGELEKVYFFSPETVETIISRVTGENVSVIDGLLGTFGPSNADLVLINPNGLMFGQNARLDVQGAFTATTATGVFLGGQGLFGTDNFASDSLLSIRPSAFFFSNLETPSAIKVESLSSSEGLRVSQGETLSLLGGDVIISNGNLGAFGGRIEIGSVNGAGNIGIANNNALIFPDSVQRGSVRIENGSILDVQLEREGNIQVQASSIDVLSGSRILSGIEMDMGTSESKAGDLILSATDEISISGAGTRLENVVESGASGQGGDLIINANTLTVSDRALLGSVTLGNGNAGNMLITITGDTTKNNLNIQSGPGSKKANLR